MRSIAVGSSQHQVKEFDRTNRYQTELLRQLRAGLSRKDAGQGPASAFFDTEEVRGSNPLAPTKKPQVRRPAALFIRIDSGTEVAIRWHAGRRLAVRATVNAWSTSKKPAPPLSPSRIESSVR